MPKPVIPFFQSILLQKQTSWLDQTHCIRSDIAMWFQIMAWLPYFSIVMLIMRYHGLTWCISWPYFMTMYFAAVKWFPWFTTCWMTPYRNQGFCNFFVFLWVGLKELLKMMFNPMACQCLILVQYAGSQCHFVVCTIINVIIMYPRIMCLFADNERGLRFYLRWSNWIFIDKKSLLEVKINVVYCRIMRSHA